MASAERPVRNFGKNITFTPLDCFAPQSEDQVLDLLEVHRGRQIRVVGSRHAWSDAAAADDVLIDLRQLEAIGEPARDGDRFVIQVGGGCTINRLLGVLRTRHRLTLPTIGTVTRQTIAGAISTGTHGSGRSSLSHYVRTLRVAAYSEDGRPRIYEWSAGQDLRAARCGLGCTGVILSVTIECVPDHHVLEQVVVHASLASVLREEREYPLQEFALVPYLWKYIAYNRKDVGGREWRGRAMPLRTWCYRIYKLAGVDLFFHLLVKAALLPRTLAASWLGALSDWLVRFTYRALPLLVGPGVWITKSSGAIDQSSPALTRRHHYFRHLEMEVFVPACYLERTIALLHAVTGVFAGVLDRLPPDIEADLRRVNLLELLDRRRGRYSHHYPFYFRRVLRDDTLISMTADADGPYYAIGVFCYLRNRRRYYEFATFIAAAVMRLYGGRLHWGKYLPMFPQPPVTLMDMEAVYPALPLFREFCLRVDPGGVFRGAFSRRVLGLAPGPVVPRAAAR